MAKILIIAGISMAVIIAIISAMIYNIPSDGKEVIEIKDSAQIQPTSNDSVSVTDSADVSKSGVDFYINEEGKKVYVITITDSPDLKD